MDRDQLKAWLDGGLSLSEIGRLTGRDPSTVGYWVQKHGLVANGNARFAPRGGLTRDQLAGLVQEGATLREIAERLDRSISTVRYWLSRYGLKTSGHRRRRRVFQDADKAGLARVQAECERHGAVNSSGEATVAGGACSAARRMSSTGDGVQRRGCCGRRGVGASYADTPGIRGRSSFTI